MLLDLSTSPILAALAALIPASFYWWSTRGFLRELDDPLLPERLLALQRRSGVVSGLTIAVLIATAFSTIVWSIPLLILARLLASYQLRRALYNETWSVPTYLLVTLKAIVALGGFWLMLATMPMVARTAGRLDWAAGAAIAAVLLVWNARYPEVVLRLFNAGPVRREGLLARFNAIVERCGLQPVRFAVADLRGGAVLNALALPSTKRPSVLFTDTLLSHLDEDESVAICAHELAHLEYYNARRLRQSSIVVWILIASGVAIAPLIRFTDFQAEAVAIGWTLALLAFLVAQVRHRQKNETESDQRAVALTGDPEALVRALTKAYAFNRFPRRLEGQFEQQATHPSLARRIRDIRATSAAPPAAFHEPLAVTCVDGTALTLDSGSLHWADNDGATHAVPYAQLTEFRFDTGRRRSTRLVAVQKSGRQWAFVLHPQDVARVQAALDIVDGQFAEPLPPDQWTGMARIVASLATILALLGGQLAAALVVVLAGLRPARHLLGAAGFAGLTGVAVMLRDRPFDPRTLACIALALFSAAAALTFFAAKTTYARRRRSDASILAMLQFCAVAAAASLFLNGLSAVGLYQSALASSAAPVLMSAVAGALAFSGSRVSHVAATVSAAAAVASLGLGTSWFLDTLGSDPFLQDSPAFADEIVSVPATTEFSVPYYVSELRLSPQARRVALVSYQDIDEEQGTAFFVGRPGEELTRVMADDLVFLDDDRLLVMRSKMGRIELEELSIASAHRVLWRTELRDIYVTQLVVRSGGREWMVLGTDDERDIIRLEGRIGEPGARETRWSVSRENIYPVAIAGSGSEVLVAETDYDFDIAGGGILSRLTLLRYFYGRRLGVRWWRTGPDDAVDLGKSQLWAGCSDDGVAEDQLLCSAFDGKRTHVGVINGATGRMTAVGWLDGHFVSEGRSSTDGWVSGFAESAATALNLRSRKAFRFPDEAGRREDARSIAATDTTIAGVWLAGQSSSIRLFPLPAATAAR